MRSCNHTQRWFPQIRSFWLLDLVTYRYLKYKLLYILNFDYSNLFFFIINIKQFHLPNSVLIEHPMTRALQPQYVHYRATPRVLRIVSITKNSHHITEFPLKHRSAPAPLNVHGLPNPKRAPFDFVRLNELLEVSSKRQIV